MQKELKKIVIGLSIALMLGILSYLLSLFAFSGSHALLIGGIVFIVSLWATETFSIGIVSIFPLFLFPLLGIIEFKNALPNYFQPVLLLFIGGMLLALAIEKVKLHNFLASKILGIFPASPRGAVYALAITAAVLSSILSNTTVVLIMLPLALALQSDVKLKVRLLLAIAYGATIGGIFTPIGTPPNIILLGFAEKFGVATPGFFNWMLLMLPFVAIMLLVMPLFLSLRIGKEKYSRLKTAKPNKDQKKLLFVLFALIILLLVNSPIKPWYNGLGLNENYILLAFGLLMFLPGFSYLKIQDLTRLPYGILALFGAGFTIAFAVIESGLGGAILPYISGIAGIGGILAILILVAIITISSEIMSNTAQVSIVLPLMHELGKQGIYGSEFLLLLSTIAVSLGFMLPTATPPNAIVFASKEIKIKDMISLGFLIDILGIILLSCVAFFFWRFFIG